MRGPESVVAEVRPTLEANRDELLDALQDEAEEEVPRWASHLDARLPTRLRRVVDQSRN